MGYTSRFGGTSVRRACVAAASLVLSMIAMAPKAALATNILTPGAVVVDRSTQMTIGIQLLISNDDDRDARVAVRYRPVSSPFWLNGLDLFRVHPEDVTGISIPQQFAGSLFNLIPNTAYEVQLTGIDPDGAVASIPVVNATTRAVPPANPASPVVVNVSTAAQLTTALNNAVAGHVITLAAGTYTGNFTLSNKSGTATDPIVIRGAGQGVTIINGNCGVTSTSCQSPINNACRGFDIHGNYVHIEDLTVQNSTRGIWLRNITSPPNTPTIGNVVRRVTMTNVCIGIASVSVPGVNPQTDFYVCDNDLTGAVPDWPHIYQDDNPDGIYANAAGVHVQGNGHVVCHNRIRRFGDGIRYTPDDDRGTTRAYDIYGNDILTGYDNGIELDRGQGNVRAFRNRLLNTLGPLSFQPILGGPAYAFRNVIVNVAREPFKFARSGIGDPPVQSDPSGMLVFHNTIVSPPTIDSSYVNVALALAMINPANTSHNYYLFNNLFVGRGDVLNLRTVDWRNLIDEGVFDYNGYFPDGNGGNRPGFRFGAGAVTHGTFAALQGSGTEINGVIVPQGVFANGMLAPTTYTTTIAPSGANIALASGTTAIDEGWVLPNINDLYTGTAPDLGALERACTKPGPIYGPRPLGTDESNMPIGCEGDVDGCRSNPGGTTCLTDDNGCTDDVCQSGVCAHTCAVGATGRCTGPFCLTNQTCQLSGQSCICQ